MLQYLKSKTVWNQLLGPATIAAAMFGLDIPEEMKVELAAGLAAVFGLVGIVIRRFTTTPLSEK